MLVTAALQEGQPGLLDSFSLFLLLFLSIALMSDICAFHELVSYITQALYESHAVSIIRVLTNEDSEVHTAEVTCPSLRNLAALGFKPS